MTNKKMSGTKLVDWGYEKGHKDLAVKQRGLIRLGVWIEITEPVWQKFKKANPERNYFIITRGILPLSFYKKLDRDKRCQNIQISVDLQPKGGSLCVNCYSKNLFPLRNSVAKNGVPSCMYFGEKNNKELTPSSRRLEALAKLDKTIFRAKTTADNAVKLYNVLSGIGIADSRIMETPLRLRAKKERRQYGDNTPFQVVVDKNTAKCNSKCEDCKEQPGNSGILYCAVNKFTLKRLES